MRLFIPHQNSGSSRYCGPTAIAAITGLPGSDIRDAVRQTRGNIMNAAGSHMRVTAMNNTDLIGAMKILGWHVVEEWSEPKRNRGPIIKVPDPRGNWHDGQGGRFFYKRPLPDGFKPFKFSDFLRERGNDGPFIVNVTGHYIAISEGELCDTIAAEVPLEVDRYLTTGRKRSYRNSWVWKWWKFLPANSISPRGD